MASAGSSSMALTARPCGGLPRPDGASASAGIDQQVASRPEAIDDPIEVALALPVALGLGEARVAVMFVPGRRQPTQRDRPPHRLVVLIVAQDEAPPDVEVSVEDEVLIDRAARDGV